MVMVNFSHVVCTNNSRLMSEHNMIYIHLVSKKVTYMYHEGNVAILW